jgi:hypothetical protein
MPGFTVSAANSAATAIRGRVTHMSLHTADSASGGSEFSTGGYARVAIAPADFSTVANGVFSPLAAVAFQGPASTAVPFVGLWDGATFLGMAPRTGGDAATNAEGVYQVTTGTQFGFALHNLI